MLLTAYIIIVHVAITHGVYTAIKDFGLLDDTVPRWSDWLVTLVLWPYLLGVGLMGMVLADEEEIEVGSVGTSFEDFTSKEEEEDEQ